MQNEQSPLFKQGMPTLVKLIIFVVLALILLVGDARFKVLSGVRTAVGMLIYPFQRIAIIPSDLFDSTSEQFRSGDDMLAEIDELKAQLTELAPEVQRNALLEKENAQLRSLLALKTNSRVPVLAGEILYDIHNNFTNRIVVNRGSDDGVLQGQAVIDENGVVGQISRVWKTSSEVTLLTDRDQAIPVLNSRTGDRSVLYGGGQSGYLEMPYSNGFSSMEEGDLLITSGIDGVYPSGVAVAVIAEIIRPDGEEPGRIICQPKGGVNQNRHVLITLTDIDSYPPEPPMETKRKKGELPQPQGGES